MIREKHGKDISVKLDRGHQSEARQVQSYVKRRPWHNRPMLASPVNEYWQSDQNERYVPRRHHKIR